ncbi:MAG: gamma-glutamyl-gamma-aminobutyrate hydrolase family protein [Burkholderiaceae bacterium]
MTKPVVGVIGNTLHLEDRFHVQMCGEWNFRAIAQVAGALPVLFASIPEVTDIATLLDTVDGVLLTGARANVHPSLFGETATSAYEPFDTNRDTTALALVETCIARGVPLFGICRGFQEMNVAFGGTLHPEIRELPGRMNHRMPRLENGEIHPDINYVFADRHDVLLTPGGYFSKLYGKDTIRVNSLHGQGILEPGKRIIVEGVAEDSTIEAIRVAEATSFAVGVQWHAEFDPQTNPVNQRLFEDFGNALKDRKSGDR